MKAFDGTFVFREARAADMQGILHVRTSVTENLLTQEQLDHRGITSASVAASFETDAKGWVAEQNGQIVAFSIANRTSSSIFALFVLPSHEGVGLGRRLLGMALRWLWQNGADRVWLTTGAGTRAARFYERQGWICLGTDPNGELRFEHRRPPTIA